ncbi:MAG: uroporphyrinogen decarboxylase family protein [Anaerolineae bacterium]
MTSRERVLKALNFQEPDRVPITDSPWGATIERWWQEGLPRDVPPEEYFGFEITSFGADTTPMFPIRVLEETDEYIVETTSTGGVRRNHKDYSTTPEIIDYPCKSREDWERLKPRLQPSKDRVDWTGQGLYGLYDEDVQARHDRGRIPWYRGLDGCRKARADGKFVCYSGAIGYDKLQSYVATERLLMAIIDEPDWVRDMYETDADLNLAMYDVMVEGGYQFDGAYMFCDLGYRNGLLFSPKHYEQQLHPVFKRIFGFFNDRGLPVILHSCGRVKDLIPYFIDEGLRCLQPLEVKAGMDLIELKQKWGKDLAFMGGIDVRAMADANPHAIEEEIRRKIPVAMKGGGYIYHSDHSIPTNVSFQQFERTLALVRQYGVYR